MAAPKFFSDTHHQPQAPHPTETQAESLRNTGQIQLTFWRRPLLIDLLTSLMEAAPPSSLVVPSAAACITQESTKSADDQYESLLSCRRCCCESSPTSKIYYPTCKSGD